MLTRLSMRSAELRKRSASSKRTLARLFSSRVTLFSVALGLRSLYLILVAQNFDSNQYWLRFSDTAHFRNVASWFATGNLRLEDSLLLVGPGYGYILYIWSALVGWSAWSHLALQIIVSAFNCVLLSTLCSRLNLKKGIGLLAGYIQAFSLTAITFSCTLYTETWFIFFTLLTLITFLKASRSGTFGAYLVFASLAYCAAMVRSVGQFYPVALFGFVVVYGLYRRISHQSGIRLVKPLIGMALALALISTWPLRNYLKHDVFTISETGTRAAKRYWLAAAVSGSYDKNEIEQRRMLWDEQLYQRYGTRAPSLSQRHQFDISVVRDTVLKYPAKMARAYLKNVWTNMTKDSRLQYIQTPQLLPLWQLYNKKLASGLGPPLFWLTLLGAVFLLLEGQSFAALFLIILYSYLGLITGATFWQGSRIFLPGEVAWAPLVSVSVFWGIEKARRLRAGFR